MSDFEGICELQNINEYDFGDTYLNDGACKQFIEPIERIWIEDLKLDLKNCGKFSALTGGSTDSGVIEEEIMFMKYIQKVCGCP